MRRSAIMSVLKDENWDRLILDRRGPNGEEAHLRRSSQNLAPGWVLTDLTLEPDEELRIFATDLSEMFYSFAITAERARSNCLPLVCRLWELDDSVAASVYRREHPQATPDDEVLVSLFTEPMGDVNAVDYAQEAHANVLASGGSWIAEHRVESLKPLPRGPILDLLTVDGHLGLVKVKRPTRSTTFNKLPVSAAAHHRAKRDAAEGAHSPIDGYEDNCDRTSTRRARPA